MKLALSYNVFDGIELLEYSIKEVREVVDYVNVIYQTTSNYGEKTEFDERISKMEKNGLIDNVILYEPLLNLRPKQNETIKRNLGLQDIKDKKFDYFINLDTDEFFKKEDIIKGLKFMKENPSVEETFVKNIRYYKYPTIQLSNTWEDYAPFIYKVNKNNLGEKYTHNVDPSRSYGSMNKHFFKSNEIIMHHMWMVRDDIEKKFRNKSSKNNFIEGIDETINFYKNYKGEGDVIFYRQGKVISSPINKTKNIFNIKTK